MPDGTNQDRHKTDRQKSPAGFVLCALVAILLCGAFWYVERERYYIYHLHRVMPTGFEDQGLTVEDVELDNTIFSGLIGHGVPSSTALRAETGGRVFWLTGLADLRGRLHISNVVQALQFVRIATNDGMLWSRMAAEHPLEVHRGSDADNPYANIAMPSGRYAVLSDRDYMRDGFSAPVVAQTSRGYTITRWIWPAKWFPNNGNVELWEETVTPDAGYSYRVLASKPAPTSHGEQWDVPAKKYNNTFHLKTTRRPKWTQQKSTAGWHRWTKSEPKSVCWLVNCKRRYPPTRHQRRATRWTHVSIASLPRWIT